MRHEAQIRQLLRDATVQGMDEFPRVVEDTGLAYQWIGIAVSVFESLLADSEGFYLSEEERHEG